MKKGFLLISSFASILLFGQHFCGFEARQKELDRKYPENKAKRERINQELRKKGTAGVLKEYGFATDKQYQIFSEAMHSANYQGQIYEIPVVVHVIESKHPDDASVKLTDEQIKTWIDNANAIYATTYGNGFFPEGNGFDKGAVIPFKLVLAKRTPECQPTNGIIRYDATNLANYSKNGLADGTVGLPKKGAESSAIKALAPHWPETSYYNIYVVIGFDGNKDGHGLMGWASLPDSNLSDYETVMKAAVVTKPNDVTLAHEFGHSLGLLHPFHGADYSSGQCPSNSDCNVDNDGVCDTEPTKSLIGISTPTNRDTNPCTGKNFEGVQYNIMNYTLQPKKFTPGQRDKALALFLSQKGFLVNSRGATAPGGKVKNIDMTNTCSPAKSRNPNNNYEIGITRVQLGNINNISDAFDKIYVDYSKATCLSDEVYTDIPDNTPITFTGEGGGYNNQWIKVWIDYNNNGSFERNELVGQKVVSATDNVYSFTFTPPANAVKNTYLRMRVRGDHGDLQACSVLNYGQEEDYAVRIVTPDFVDPDDPNNSSEGRVGINTEEPQTTLDVRETDINLLPAGSAQGVSFPNFTTEQRNTFQNVKEGTMIYNTTLNCLEIYTGTSWRCLQ